MKKYLLYWFVGHDIHIETFDELPIANTRKKVIESYIFCFEDSDVFLYDLHDIDKGE